MHTKHIHTKDLYVQSKEISSNMEEHKEHALCVVHCHFKLCGLKSLGNLSTSKISHPSLKRIAYGNPVNCWRLDRSEFFVQKIKYKKNEIMISELP